jgi:hypothetical protein
MKSVLPSVVARCSSEKAQLFGGTFSLHLEIRRSSHARHQQKAEAQIVAWRHHIPPKF